MVTIALVRDYERFKIMDINGTHYYWLIWLFWSQKVTKIAIFQTEYLKSQQLARQVHVTKKLDFRLNFILPGVPDSENWRFLSYTACKIDFLTVFSTVFSLLTQYWKCYSLLAGSNAVPMSKLLIHRLNITLRYHEDRYFHQILVKMN